MLKTSFKDTGVKIETFKWFEKCSQVERIHYLYCKTYFSEKYVLGVVTACP